MSEKSQPLTGPASQYPPDPDAFLARSQTPPSPSAAETTQFPQVEDEEYDAAGADDSFTDDSQSMERSYHTDSFERVSDSSVMTVPPSQPTQPPQQGAYPQQQYYSQGSNMQQYPQDYQQYPPQQPAQPVRGSYPLQPQPPLPQTQQLQRPPQPRQSERFQQLIQKIEHQLLQAKNQLAQWFVRGKRYLSSEAKPQLAQQLSHGKPYLEQQQLRAKTTWSVLATKLRSMARPATYVGGGMVASLVLLIIIGVLVDDSSSSSTAKSSGYTYDDITIPATWCDNDNYVYAATNGKDYLSVCKTDSGYLFQALSDDALTEGEAKKVNSSYVVNTENHVAVLEKDTMTITDTNGNVQSVVSLNRWLSK